MNSYYKLSAALIGTAIVAVQPYIVVSQDINGQSLGTLAKEITVVIHGQNPGSGVIIGKQGNNYYVLTAKHVVATPDEYEILTVDGITHKLEYSTVKKLPGVDLALAQFTSTQNYRVAEIGDSETATAGTAVYISGWPHPGPLLTQRIYQITGGTMSGRPLEALQDGYALVYTNITRSGMSGGPVLDEKGRVIGIHGRADGEPILNPETGQTVNVKSGFNLGIPIATFLQLTPPADLPPNPAFALPIAASGDRFLQQNRLPEAISYYERAVALDGKYFPAVFKLGQLKYERGDIETAIRLLQTAVEIDSSKAIAPQLALAAALYTKGERDRALTAAFALFQTRINQDWEAETKNLLSPRLVTDIKGIIAQYQKVVSLGTQEFSVEFNLGLMKYEQGDLEGAIQQLQTAAEKDRGAVTQLALAAALFAKGDRDRSLNIASAAIESNNFYNDLNLPDWEKIKQNLWGDRLLANLQQIVTLFSPLKTFKAHVGGIDYLAFSSDNQILVSSNWDDTEPNSSRSRSTIKLWNPRTGEMKSSFVTPAGSAFAISPDSQTLAVAETDIGLKLWNLRTGKEIGAMKDSNNTIYQIAFSSNGEMIAASTPFGVKVWNVRTGELVLHAKESEIVRSVAFSPDNQTVAGGGHENNIKLWDVSTGQLKNTFTGHSDYISHLAFSPDGMTLASSSEDKTIKLWNVRTGKLLNTIATHGNVAFSSDGMTLIAGSFPIKLWNVRTGEVKNTIRGGRSNNVALSPDNQLVACEGGKEGTIDIWSVKP